MNAAYVLYVQEFQSQGEPLAFARERAHDTFLTPEELRRKQNAAALKNLGAR